MSIANAIIAAMNHTEEDKISKIREKLRSSKVLNKKDFKELVEVLQTKAIEILSINDLTVNEYNLIGKGLMASKIRNLQETIDFIIERNDKRTANLLHCILNKGSKFDTSSLQNYLEKMIKREIHLIHLKVLAVVSKNYPRLLNEEIFDFCEKNSHPICKEILKKHKLDIE